MSDFTPIGSTVHSSGSTAANGSTSNSNNVQDVKNTLLDNASSAYNAAANHPLTQNIKNTVTNGPVADNVLEQTAKTQNEFSNLAAARTTPATPAVTGQHLTHYHSFFSSLLSWENPRASAIAYVLIVLFIFGARYLNLLRYAFKLTWMTLGVTILAEIAGKALFARGFTSQIRPRKYYVLPKDTLDAMIGDVHELINFFVIESQRIVFAENVFASATAFIGSFISYYLIKIVPIWGMALIGTSALFLIPLIYISNKEIIDHHIQNASEVVNQQTNQVKSLASHHASVAAETTKQYVGDYSAKAQELIGSRSRSTSPAASLKPVKTESTSSPLSSSTPVHKSTILDSAVPASKPIKLDSSISASKPSTIDSDLSSFKSTNLDSAVPASKPTTIDSTFPASKSTNLDSAVPAFKSTDLDSTVPLVKSSIDNSSVPAFESSTFDSAFKSTDFPVAPKEDFKSEEAVTAPITSLPGSGLSGTTSENEPLLV